MYEIYAEKTIDDTQMAKTMFTQSIEVYGNIMAFCIIQVLPHALFFHSSALATFISEH
jgi:hypothetical protein